VNFEESPKLKIEVNSQFLFLGEELVNLVHSNDKSTPEEIGARNTWSCSPVLRGPGARFRVPRFHGMFGAFSVVVSLLSLWQAARYWTFHARERIFDFTSQHLTYRYPDFLEHFR